MNIGCKYCLAAAAALALSACGPSAKKQESAANDKTPGLKVRAAEATAGAGTGLPSGMPAYAKVYPGAAVVAVLVAGSSPMGSMISFRTQARPDAVLSYYRKNATDAGMTLRQDIVAGQTLVFSATKGSPDQTGTADQIVSVTIVPQPDGTSFVQMTYK